MQPLFVSFVDNNNRPLLVHPIGEQNAEYEIRYNVLSNLALDYFEDLSKQNESIPSRYLFQMDNIVIYGEYLHHKGLKLLVGLPCRNDEIAKSVFQKTRSYYLESIMNPFQDDWTDHIKRKLDSIDIS